MTRLFTRDICKKCGEKYGDTAYITGKREIVGETCFKCKFDEFKKLEDGYDEA